MFSMTWNSILYQMDPCPKCHANAWRKDWVFNKQTGGRRDRYSCLFCGLDVFTGSPAYLREEPDSGAPSIEPGLLDSTDGDVMGALPDA